MSPTRKALAGFWVFAGGMHFVIPRSYEVTVPPNSPVPPKQAVAISGIAEIAGGLAVLDDRTLSAARWGLLALLVAVFPANVHMAMHPEQVPGLDLDRIPRWLLWVRLPLQPLCAWWVWRGTAPGA
ncbi:MAG: hypothetical protein ABR536_01040 [Solirubrobacterales bacterium]